MDEDAALPSSPRHEVRMQPQRIFCTTAVPVLEVISQDPGKGEHLPSQFNTLFLTKNQFLNTHKNL